MTEAVLLVGGRVFTGRRYAEALLVEGSRVLAVGTEDETRREVPTGADRYDLGSSLVVPGLADAHLHLGEMTRDKEALDLRSARSIPALQERLRRAAEERAPGPLVGRGLDLEELAEHRWPTAPELDAAVADRPVVVLHVSGHAAVANTAALDRVYGPARGGRSEAPHRAVVVEEELGAFKALVEEALPLTPEGVERTARELVSLGITTVGTMNTSSQELSVLRQLERAGRLPFRVRAYPPLDRFPEASVAHPRDQDQVEVVGVKAFLDGAFGPRTASLSAPYADEPSNRGIDRGDDSTLAAELERARRAGLAPALHAIGDGAVERAARLLAGRWPGSAPSRIEHASLTPPRLFAELRAAGAHLVVQPGFVLSDLWLRERLGPERARWAYAFRTLSDQGLPLAGSSDAPYDVVDPWRSMRAAVQRQDELGRSANPGPGEALTEPEALALYARGAHDALGDALGGRLEPGARADFVVLAVPRLGDALRLGGSAVRETWVGGRPVPRARPETRGRR